MYNPNDLTKLAAAAIVQLRNENDELKNKLMVEEEATKLAFSLYHQGLFTPDQLEHNLNEFRHKSIEDLQVIKKASELVKTAEIFNSFKISSNQVVDDNLSAIERFTSFIID